MKNQRVARSAFLPCLAALLPTAVLGVALAATAPDAAPVRPAHAINALAANVRAAFAPAPSPAAMRLADFAGGDSASLRNLQGSVFAANSRIAKPHSTTSDPVALQAYGTGEVVHITNAQGQVVRAPQSATDTSIAPNQPLTITVRVNNSTASTQATAVYVQIKDPDSLYDDTNLTGNPREHKVFAEDSYTNQGMPSLNHPDFGYTVNPNVTNPDGSPTYYGMPTNPDGTPDVADNPYRAEDPAFGGAGGPGGTGGTGGTGGVGNTSPPAYFGATPADNLLDPEQDTSGTASVEIFNGLGSSGTPFVDLFPDDAELPYQRFAQTSGNLYYHQRGAIGGHDAGGQTTQFITLGRVDPSGYDTFNPIFESGPNNSRPELPGPDPGDFDNPDARYTEPFVQGGGGFGGGGFGGGSTITDYGVFRAVGQEYECQYLKANDANTDPTAPFNASGPVSGFPTAGTDAVDADYGDPYYLAGVDDQNGATYTNTTTGLPVTNSPRTEWLTLHPVPGSPDLYSATWAPPYSPSDFYMDVVVYDNNNNFRIYDNVWGFSTLPFQANNDILLVMDNALGQKYAASALAGTGGLANLRPFFYGAESSFTATDVTKLPNATINFVSAGKPTSIFLPPYTPDYTANGNNPPPNAVNSKGGYPVISYLGDSPTEANTFDTFLAPETPENGLGYHSYGDLIFDAVATFINGVEVPSNNGELLSNDGDPILTRNAVTTIATLPAQNSYSGSLVTETGTAFSGASTVGTVPVPQSQAYSIWRILCRGRITPALLQNPPHPANASTPSGYAPDGFVTQPAINDPTNGFKVPAAVVPVATRCVIWVSPFTGDQPLEIPGSLDDTATQTQLQQFVAAGGRLFVTGQEAATAFANEGSTPFLNNVLNAQLVSDGSGITGPANNQTLAGQNSIGHFLSFDSLFDFQAPPTFDDVFSAFFEVNLNTTETYVAPAGAPLIIGNNYNDNVDSATYDKWRTDAALTELGPYVQTFGSASVQSRISTISPLNGATADFSIGANAGMIWHTDSTDPVGSGFGSRVVFASFGLEGLGNDYYRKTDNGTNYFFPRNQRARVLHNIVSYLRSGTFTGRIFLGTGTSTGIAGATVYLIPLPNASASHTIPNQVRQAYSAITSDGTDGNPVGYYNIQGLEPGAYRVIAYKTGYTTDRSPLNNPTGDTFAVYGDTTASVNLNISQLPPGHITGTVKFSDGTAPPVGTPVIFVSIDGTTTVNGQTTDANGDYTISAPIGTYTGTVTTTTPPASGTVSNVTVPTNADGTAGTVTANFVLALLPSTISGQVTHNGTGVPAIVAFTASGSTTTVQTAPDGTYTSPPLPAGTYTVTASATIGGAPFFGQASAPVVLSPGVPLTGVNIALNAAPNVTLSGTVTDNTPSQTPISGATVSVTGGSTQTSTVTSSGGTYTVTVPQGVYTITASKTGFVSQTVSVIVNPPGATQNFALVSEPSLTAGYKAGHYNLVSYPNEYDPSQTGSASVFSDVFGPLINSANPSGDRGLAYIYQSAIGNYVVEPTAPADALHLGRGYFIYLRTINPQFSLFGTPPSGSAIPLTLEGGSGLDGWNMIGVPSTTAISVSRLSFEFGYPNGSNIPASNAVNNGDVYGANSIPYVYAYNPTTNTYSAVTQMQPFQGYWIRAKQAGLTVLIPTGGG